MHDYYSLKFFSPQFDCSIYVKLNQSFGIIDEKFETFPAIGMKSMPHLPTATYVSIAMLCVTTECHVGKTKQLAHSMRLDNKCMERKMHKLDSPTNRQQYPTFNMQWLYTWHRFYYIPNGKRIAAAHGTTKIKCLIWKYSNKRTHAHFLSFIAVVRLSSIRVFLETQLTR